MKAAHIVGRKLDKLSHNKQTKKNKRKSRNKKSKKIVNTFNPQGLAPPEYLFSAKDLKKVRVNSLNPFLHY